MFAQRLKLNVYKPNTYLFKTWWTSDFLLEIKQKIHFCWIDVLLWTIRKGNHSHPFDPSLSSWKLGKQPEAVSLHWPTEHASVAWEAKTMPAEHSVEIAWCLSWPPSQGPGILLSFKQHKVKCEGEIFFWHTTESLTVQDYCDTLPTITVWPRYSNFVILKILQDSYT